MSHNAALVAEGTQIIEAACCVQLAAPHTLSSTPLLERVFSAIPLDTSAQHLMLSENMKLTVTGAMIAADDCDVIKAEMASIGIDGEVSENGLVCDAVQAMPAIARFYGIKPEVSVAPPA